MVERRGYFKLTTIHGVSVLFHWSFPAGGAIVASFGHVDPKQWIYYCIAYTLLIAIHECGHLLAAICLRLKVFSLEITGLGGLCRLERPRNLLDSVFVYSAGLLAQSATFFLTLVYVHRFGNPIGGFGRALVITFTLVNFGLFVINLVPQRGARSGLATDGLVLWRLFLHAFWGHPHPHPPLVVLPADKAPVFPADTRLLEIGSVRPDGFIHGIEILNDRNTPMEFVVSSLMTHLGLQRDKAIATMIGIHNTGGVLIALPTIQEANKVADAISAEASASGHRFVCRYASVEL
jgi:ATP-dependent Clp protease adapter protein ClpS